MQPTSSSNLLPWKEKLSYGFGDLASVLYWQSFMVYLTYFYTDVFGLGALAVGTMLGLSRSLDAFFDPMMGMVADRTKTRWGQFRPWLLWLCVPFAVMGVLTFTVPEFSPSGKLAWAWITYNALMILYTAINIPYTALLGVITPNPSERTSLASIKFVFAFAAGMIVSATLLPLATRLGHGSPQRGWQLAFVVVGVAATIFYLITFFNTRERVRSENEVKGSILGDLKSLVSNGPWLILVASTLCFILFVAVRSSVTIHYFKYFVGTQTLTLPSWLPKVGGTQEWHLEGLVSAFNTSGQLCSLLGVLLIPYVSRCIGGRKLSFFILLSISIVCTAAYFFLRPEQVGWMFGLNMLGCITAGPLSALLWAMYADTADYSEWKTRRRTTGLTFSASIFAQKQGWALGAWAALVLLQGVGFVANVEQGPKTLQGLIWLMSLVPAVFGVLALLALAFYPLNERRVKEISEDLTKRRASNT